MRGRKLDGEAQHDTKQAAFSAKMRVHGICISRFVFPHCYCSSLFLILSSISLISPSHQLSAFASSFFHSIYFPFLCPCVFHYFWSICLFISLSFLFSPSLISVILSLPSPIIPCALSLLPVPLLSLLPSLVQYQFCFPILLPPSFLPPLCIWVAVWTSSCRACKLVASLPLFNWCCLIGTSCLLDSVRW